jgi:hypothetical protein
MAGAVPDDVLSALQAEIQECDSRGRGRGNADVPADEDLEAFASMAAACGSADDVRALVAPICARSAP